MDSRCSEHAVSMRRDHVHGTLWTGDHVLVGQCHLGILQRDTRENETKWLPDPALWRGHTPPGPIPGTQKAISHPFSGVWVTPVDRSSQGDEPHLSGMEPHITPPGGPSSGSMINDIGSRMRA